MATHGKPVSVCCGKKLNKVINGEWVEWQCSECHKNLDERGQEYRYTTYDPAKREQS
jgi:hypothetical protein